MAQVSGSTYSQDILQVFFLSTISSVLTYGCVSVGEGMLQSRTGTGCLWSSQYTLIIPHRATQYCMVRYRI